MRLLITGAAGTIGTVLTKGLQGRHQLRGLDVREMPLLQDVVIGDISDWNAVFRATSEMEAVMHLTNVGAEWEEAGQSMVGIYNVFESARQNGVKRIAFASRAGLFPGSQIPRSIQRTAELMWRPDSFYTITKVVGECFGDMYARQHGMSVVSVRIGGIDPDEPEVPDHPHRLTHGDCVRAFEAAIGYSGGTHERVFGVSDSDWELYDVEHGRKAIGYYPEGKSIVPLEKRE